MTTTESGGNDYEVKKTGVSDCIILFHYIYTYMDSNLKGIIKYIEVMYKPTKISSEYIYIDENTYGSVINLFFDSIGDEFITNPSHNNLRKLKEDNLKLKIRRDIYTFFGVMTSGLSLDGFAPYVNHNLTINVHLID